MAVKLEETCPAVRTGAGAGTAIIGRKMMKAWINHRAEQISNWRGWARRSVVLPLIVGCASALSQSGPAQPPEVHFIWMGGNDCPPCKVWRGIELPKLQASPEFQRIRYSYVTKTIGAAVPPKFFLPEEVRPYKDILDVAGAGGPGSPQAAVIVNGQVFDYFWGYRSAEDIVMMLNSIRTGSLYPFSRCIKMSRQGRSCEVRG